MDKQTRQEDQRRALLAAYRLVLADLEHIVEMRSARDLPVDAQIRFIGYVASKVATLSYAE